MDFDKDIGQICDLITCSICKTVWCDYCSDECPKCEEDKLVVKGGSKLKNDRIIKKD